jgi:hypothetical protein
MHRVIQSVNLLVHGLVLAIALGLAQAPRHRSFGSSCRVGPGNFTPSPSQNRT